MRGHWRARPRACVVKGGLQTRARVNSGWNRAAGSVSISSMAGASQLCSLCDRLFNPSCTHPTTLRPMSELGGSSPATAVSTGSKCSWFNFVAFVYLEAVEQGYVSTKSENAAAIATLASPHGCTKCAATTARSLHTVLQLSLQACTPCCKLSHLARQLFAKLGLHTLPSFLLNAVQPRTARRPHLTGSW